MIEIGEPGINVCYYQWCIDICEFINLKHIHFVSLSKTFSNLINLKNLNIDQYNVQNDKTCVCEIK